MMTLPPTRESFCGLDDCDLVNLRGWRLFF